MPSTAAPLCFVLMPFGKKPDAGGMTIDFDAVYQEVIQPAVLDAGLEPLRSDEEMTGGVIHKPMYERLILCPFAVADLTTANANVFYELGVRHAVRPASTVLLFAEGGRLPFDVAPLRSVPYRLTADGRPEDAKSAREALAAKLREARRDNGAPQADTPIYQLVEEFPDIQRLKTDVFRDRVNIARDLKEQLARARETGLDAVQRVEQSLGNDLDAVESAVLIDLLLSYRAVRGWQQAIDLVARMPRPLAQTVMVREQLAFVLNRAGRGDDAETILNEVLASHGPSTETYSLLGRVYKDRYDRAKNEKNDEARGFLAKAVETYLKGFETDWRDAFPGINAVTLMELREPPDSRQQELIPIVAYAVKHRIAAGKPDYWDFATLIELAVLGRNQAAGEEALGEALAHVREKWEPESTARNLGMIAATRNGRGEDTPAWIEMVIAALKNRAAQ